MSTSNPSEPLRTQRRLRLGAATRQANGSRKRVGPSRREELLDIAAEQFAARGFVSVTVDDLGAAAGVSGPALYHHFESKEAMLGEMLVDISNHLLDAGRALRDASAPLALLDELISMHVDFAVDHRALISVHFRDLLQASPDDQRKVRRLQREYVEVWVDALVERALAGVDVADLFVDAVLDLEKAAARCHGSSLCAPLKMAAPLHIYL